MSGRHRVFVYGTLRCGGSNHHRMAGAIWLGEARVRGRLYAVTWYPALKLDDNAGWVEGDVFETDDETLAALDTFEGDEYERVRVEPVMTDARLAWDDDAGEAWMWQWRGGVDGLVAIPTGDWLGYLQPPTKPWWAIFGCVGVLALPIGGAVLLAWISDLLGVYWMLNRWVWFGLFLMAGGFGIYAVTMSYRMRERPRSAWLGFFLTLTTIATATCLLISLGIVLGVLVE